MSNSNNSTRIGKMVRLAILIAILLLMAFTPLGYIRFGGLEITFLTVPVIIGAIILGPVEGAILGGVFGLTSFFQCFGMSPFGAALLAVNPFFTFLVCFVPRALMGLCCGLIFKGLAAIDKTKLVSFGVASLSGALLNTVFFMSSLVLCFYNTEYIQSIVTALGAANPFHFILLFVGLQGLVEAVVCFLVGTAVSKALHRFLPVKSVHA